MKNLFKFIVPAVLVALTASCVKETGTETIPDNTRRYNLTFDVTTKTEISGTGGTRQVDWSNGDEIKYYTESGQASAVSATVNLDGGNAYVEIPRGRADEFINAVYGVSQLNSVSSDENTMFVYSPVKDNQSYTSFAQAHLCAAFSDDIENPELKFLNAAAIIKFTSSAKVSKIVFYGNNGESITGGFYGNLKITHSAGTLTVEPASAAGTTVTVQTRGTESDFYMAVIPVNFSGGITIDCYDSNLELIATKKTTNAVNTISSSGKPKIINLGNVQDWLNDPLPVAVDLGLSVKWARVNLGATEPEGYGDYFAWGETSPKSTCTWSNYTFGNSKNGPFSKYVLDAELGSIDHKTVLDLADDAAHVTLGGDWRMPTKEEVEELMSNCSWSWTTRNGVSGYRVTSNKPGYTGQSIFLPANGMIGGSSISDVGSVGNYWTASLSAEANYHAISPFFSSSYVKSGNCYRYFGLGIRPVQGAVVSVSSIEIPHTLDLIAGRWATLSATVYPDNATYKGLTWASSDESIATVDANGKVTAVSIGKATITAFSADAATTGACEVTVYQLAQSVTLDKTELEMYVGGDPVTLNATVLPSEYTIKKINWKSSDSSIATVDSEGKVTAVSAGTTKISALTTDGSNVSAACMVTVKMDLSLPSTVEAIDLGLPSGLKWASCNVGANQPEEYGAYFAWGETEAKESFFWSTYKWCNGGYNKLTKYCTSRSNWDGTESIDNKIVLDPEDDAAHVNWGGSWRMPTAVEWTELQENCIWTWTIQNGINGRLITSKKNSNSVFLPAAEYRDGTYLDTVGSLGYYWSSSLNTNHPDSAWDVGFDSGNVDRTYDYRYEGLSVRPVTE